MQNVIVYAIVALAAGYIVRLFYRKLYKKSCEKGCGCEATKPSKALRH